MTVTHEYECRTHNTKAEVDVRLGEASQPPQCPVDGEPMKRVWGTPVLQAQWKRGR